MTNKTPICSAIFILLAWPVSILAAISEVVSQPHIEVSLISDLDAVTPGDVITVGLHLNPDPDWHVYWQNPGDSGMPPNIQWNLPEQVQPGPIFWPYPEKIPVEHLVNYGYHKDVVLPVEITIGEQFGQDSVALQANASWLVCQETCIPGKAQLSLSLPVKQPVDSKQAQQIETFKNRFPQELPLLDASVKLNDQNIVIEVYASTRLFEHAKHIDFFAVNENLIEYSQTPDIHWKNNYLTISQTKSLTFTEIPDLVEGVIVIDHTNAWRFRISNTL